MEAYRNTQRSGYYKAWSDFGGIAPIGSTIRRAPGEGQGIENVNSSATFCGSRKILRDGQIFILRGDKVYTVDGVEVK